MDKIKTLISLNEAKEQIEELIDKVRSGSEQKKEEDTSGKLLIIVLCVLGSLVVIGAVAYLVYRHFSDDYLDDYEDLDDLFDDEDEEEEDEDEDAEPEVVTSDDDFEEEFKD